MTSNLGCVGLGVADAAELADLLAQVVPLSTATRQEDGSALYVWTDDSGARLTVTTDRRGAIDDVTPSYAGEPGAELAQLVAMHHAVVTADVMAEGEVSTRLVAEVLAPGPVPSSGVAAVTAFGLDVSVHDDGASFTASPASLLSPEDADRARPDGLPEHVPWPTRVAAESFFPLSLFGDEEEPEPVARLHGTVLSCRTATVEVTGQTFHAVRVGAVGMQVDVCLAADDHPQPPQAGNVVGGLVYLVADVARPVRTRRGWFGRRDR